LGASTQIQIRDDVSSVENYVTLNDLILNPRRIVPITTSEQPFVGFTERELAGFYMKRGGILKETVSELAASDGVAAIMADVQSWIGQKEPGYFFKKLVVDIDPDGLSSRKKGKAGRRAAIKMWSLEHIRSHIEGLEDPDFHPEEYSEKGYISRGSLLTDGFGLYLLGFKLRELQCVRYRRLPADRLPPRIMSTVGGVNYYLQEIRNVIQTEEDVRRLWPNAKADEIKILTLDAGQAFVVGAYAYLPEDPGGHYNMSVNQKAVLQPMFRHRRWLEGKKQETYDGKTKSIAHTESDLPPLRGLRASVYNYCEALSGVAARLSEFYDTKKKFRWDLKRAYQAEFQAIATSLLGIVGGSLGRPRDPDNPVLIGIGLGKFKSRGRLTSLHSAFLKYFIPLVSPRWLFVALLIQLYMVLIHFSFF